MKTFLTLAVAIISCCTASAQLLSGKFLTNNFLPAFRSPDTLTNSPVYVVGDTNLGLDAQLILGPGTTNVLYRSGSDLIYTNGTTDVKIIAYNGSGGGAALEAQGTTAFLSTAGTSSALGLRSGSDQLSLFSGAFYPTVDMTESLGTSTKRFLDVNLAGSEYVWGFGGTIITNYSRLAISHGGTNGNITFESQSAGTAGNPRPFNFTGASVQFGDVLQNAGFPPYTLAESAFYTNVTLSNMAVATNALVTVPSGYIMEPISIFGGTTNASSTTVTTYVTTNGVAYRINSANVAANSTLSLKPASFLLEGETLSLAPTLVGVNANFTGRLTSTSCGIKVVRFVAFSAGDNTVYTVPAGKWFWPHTTGSDTLVAYVTSAVFSNSSGGVRTYKIYYVPNGGTVGSGTQITSSTISDNTAAGFTIPALPEGFSIVINTDSSAAGQMFYLTGFEK